MLLEKQEQIILKKEKTHISLNYENINIEKLIKKLMINIVKT